MTRQGAILALAVLIVAVGTAWWAGTQMGTDPAPSPAETSANGQPATTENGLLRWERRASQVHRDVEPSVVNITSTVVTETFFGERAQEGTGSGFVYDNDGRIITNHHVVQNASQIEVTFPDGSIATAEVIGTDPLNDLAVIDVDDIPADQLHPVEMGDSSQLMPGQLAIAIGNPFGQFERTITMGVVSALDRTINREGQRPIFGLIQTDASINRGNSGGPLLNSRGKVIGITTAIYSPSGGSVGIGFAVPADTVAQEVPVLIERGRYPHPWVGITTPPFPLTPDLAERLRRGADLDLGADRGVFVIEATPGGPADQAGIQGADRAIRVGNRQVPIGGDIITAVDGVEVASHEDIIRYLETETEVGQTVTLTLVRDGQEMTADVTLQERPPGQQR
ncbi:MAG: S1C family serine protease [Candidatus Bipolaricaulia bacterium]